MTQTIFVDIDPARAKPWLHIACDWRRPDIDESYDLLWDEHRSYGQLSPRPTAVQVAKFYQTDEYYTHSSLPQHRARSGLQQRALNKVSWLADNGTEPNAAWWRETLGTAPLRVLEIGCGNGSNLTLLKSLGHDAVGIEPDPNAMKVAQNQGHDVWPGTAEDLPNAVDGRIFDVVIFMHVLEHCISPDQALANATGLLTDTGILVAEVPNNACAGAAFFGSSWYWLDVPRHLNFFTSKSLSELFHAAGLSQQRTFFRGYCRQFSPQWKAAHRQIASVIGHGAKARNRDLDYWFYFAQTAFATQSRKCDSVRIVGRASSLPVSDWP